MKIKQAFSFLLVCALLFSLVACTNNSNNTTETTPTVQKPQTNVAEPLTWDRINAIPLANDSMTEEQLRQICLDFMRLQLTFGWTPSEQVTYHNGYSDRVLYPDKVYGGIPYRSSHFGNIYTATEYFDPDNGMIDVSADPKIFEMFSNQCSASAFWAWNRVCNSLTYAGTSDATEKTGCIRLGNYTYDETLTDYRNLFTTEICKANGRDVMYEAYALLEPADGIVNYTTGGHVRMISTKPNIVRKADGTIDAGKSTVTFMDQITTWSELPQSNGVPYEVQGGVDSKVTFVKLFNDGYLPFTLAELNKDKPVDKGTVSINCTDTSASVSKLTSCEVTSNYAISNIYISVKSSDNQEVYNKSFIAYEDDLVNFTAPLQKCIIAEDLSAYTDGSHTIEVSVRIGTGEKLVAYSGTLTA